MGPPPNIHQSIRWPRSSQSVYYGQRDNLSIATGSVAGVTYNSQGQPSRAQVHNDDEDNATTAPYHTVSEVTALHRPVCSHVDPTETHTSVDDGATILSDKDKNELVASEGIGPVKNHLRDEVRDHLLFDRSHAFPDDEYSIAAQKNINVVFHASLLFEDCLTREDAPYKVVKDEVMKEIQTAVGMKPRKRTWAGFYVANILAAYTAARTETIIQCLERGEMPTTAANSITANLLLLIDQLIAFDFTGKPLVPTAVHVEPKARSARLHLRSLKMKQCIRQLNTGFQVLQNCIHSVELSGFRITHLGHYLKNRRVRFKRELQLPLEPSDLEDDSLGCEILAKSAEIITALDSMELGLKCIADRAGGGEWTPEQCWVVFQEVNGYYRDVLDEDLPMATCAAIVRWSNRFA